MDLSKIGKLLCDLRNAKGLTQKQVAEKLGISPKTVSKWETGHGFPDVSALSALADVLGVSERVLLDGSLNKNPRQSVNVKKTKFYVCPECGSVMQGMGECEIICCGKILENLEALPADESHIINISDVEDEFYIEISHEMTKEHYIRFVAYLGVDRSFLVSFYPEQNPAVRIPRMYGGKLYICCNKHGLFVY